MNFPVIPPGVTLTIYTPTHIADEYGEGPSWCRFQIDQAFMTRLATLKTAIRDLNVYAIEELYAIDWQNGSERRMGAQTLTVYEDAFVFSGTQKHTTYDVESLFISDQVLSDAIASCLSNNQGTCYLEIDEELIDPAQAD